MLRNFIDDSYLERFYPNIINNRQGQQVDFSETIANAFDVLINELQAKGFDPRLCMVPIDLNRLSTASSNIQQVTPKSTTATWTGEAWEGGPQRRFVVNMSIKTTSDDWSVLLQGSNLSTKPDAGDASWETVSTLRWDNVTAASEKNEVCSVMYRWYRVKAVRNSGAASMTFTALLYETVFDPLIAYKALTLIANSWKTGLNPKWDDMKEEMQRSYDSTITAIKFTYDNDEDGIPEKETTEPLMMASVRMHR